MDPRSHEWWLLREATARERAEVTKEEAELFKQLEQVHRMLSVPWGVPLGRITAYPAPPPLPLVKPAVSETPWRGRTVGEAAEYDTRFLHLLGIAPL